MAGETALGTAVVAVRARLDDLDKDLSAAKGKADTAAKSIEERLSSIGKKMQGIGAGMSIGITAPLTLLGKSAIDASSDMAESSSKSQIVFGEWNDVIVEFALDSAKNLGMSRQAATEAAGTFGNLFTAMGIGQEPAADMSTSLLQLAADLASFNNQDPEEVLLKLRSGLVGETEPLRSLGVNLNAADIEARAMAMGLADANGEVDAAGKAQAAYSIIMEQTKTAQGDFARTADGLANSQRIAKAEMADLSAEMGTVLLPIAQQGVGVLRDIVGWFGALDPSTQTAIIAVAGFLAILGPLVGLIGTLLTVGGALIPIIGGIGAAITGAVLPAIGAVAIALGPILLIVAAVIAVGAALYLAYTNNFLGIKDLIDGVVASILPTLQSVVDFLGGVLTSAINLISGVFNNVLLPAFQAVSNFITTTLMPFFQALADVGLAVVNLAATALAGLWQNVLLPALTAVATFISGTVQVVFQTLSNLFNNTISPAITAVAAVLDTTLGPAFRAISAFISDTLNGALGSLRSTYIDPLVRSFESISDAIKGATRWLSDLASGIGKITLPAWLTPGSPTPFELGLWGIDKALEAVSRDASLEFSPVSQPRLASAPAAAGATWAESGGGGRSGATIQVSISQSFGANVSSTDREQWKAETIRVIRQALAPYQA